MNFKQFLKERLKKDSDDPCQPGYVQVGMKQKDGKSVPNCVPLNEAEGEEEDGLEIDWDMNDDGTLTIELGDEEYTLSKELTKELHDDIMDSLKESIFEAKGEYQGEKVTLEKPFRTPDDDKAFAVYVKNDKGNVVKVRFGDSDMPIQRDDDEARKSFMARHNCSDKTDKTKAGYWSCKAWEKDTDWV